MDLNAVKLKGIDALMNINDPKTLERAVEAVCNMAYKEDVISKDELLMKIKDGLMEVKYCRQKGVKAKSAEELLDELYMPTSLLNVN